MNAQNGTLRARKPQLADSIGRLDEMVDGLATAIPGAVADAVREALGTAFAAAVKDAVKAAVAEALAEAGVGREAKPTPVPMSAETPATPPAPPAVPGRWARVKSALGRLRRWASGKAAPAVARVTLGWAAARLVAGETARSRPATLATLATGSAAALGGYALGPVGSAVLLGLSAGALTATAVLAAPVVRLAAGLRALASGEPPCPTA